MLNNIDSALGWTVSSILGDSGPQALHDPTKLALKDTLVCKNGVLALTYAPA